MIGITAPELQSAGYKPNSVRFPSSIPSPSAGQYLATTTTTHHLHCLHYLWQDHHLPLLPEIQAKKAAAGAMYDRHYEHCVDYLRMGLMCNYDTTVIAYNWVRDHDVPTPNGNTVHKCVNWGAVQGWLGERSVDMPLGFEWRQPDGAVALDYNP